jgi:hypothetical protein
MMTSASGRPPRFLYLASDFLWRIVPAVRRTLILLLLVAAAVHPLAHLSEDSVTCPCVHGAIAQLVPEAMQEPPASLATHATYATSFVRASVAGDVPARAPPVA